MRKGVFEVTAINKDPDQAAEVYGLIRNFVYFVVLYCTLECMFLYEDIESPDQTAHVHSLIWAFTVGICLKTHFLMT